MERNALDSQSQQGDIMKRVVSISLGSSQRNKKVNATLFGTDFEIERIGTDGDMKRFQEMVAELEGKVDAARIFTFTLIRNAIASSKS